MYKGTGVSRHHVFPRVQGCQAGLLLVCWLVGLALGLGATYSAAGEPTVIAICFSNPETVLIIAKVIFLVLTFHAVKVLQMPSVLIASCLVSHGCRDCSETDLGNYWHILQYDKCTLKLGRPT